MATKEAAIWKEAVTMKEEATIQEEVMREAVTTQEVVAEDMTLKLMDRILEKTDLTTHQTNTDHKEEQLEAVVEAEVEETTTTHLTWTEIEMKITAESQTSEEEPEVALQRSRKNDLPHS